jgi:hypothetical protein
LRACGLCVQSCLTPGLARGGSPTGGDQADEREEQRRHIPQLALFDDRDAAAAVADRLGQRRDVGRREEAAAGVSAIRLSSVDRIAASKYSASPADARTCIAAAPRSF